MRWVPSPVVVLAPLKAGLSACLHLSASGTAASLVPLTCSWGKRAPSLLCRWWRNGGLETSHSSLWQKGIGPRSPELLDHSLRSARAIGRKARENGWKTSVLGEVQELASRLCKRKDSLCVNRIQKTLCALSLFSLAISADPGKDYCLEILPLYSQTIIATPTLLAGRKYSLENYFWFNMYISASTVECFSKFWEGSLEAVYYRNVV